MEFMVCDCSQVERQAGRLEEQADLLKGLSKSKLPENLSDVRRSWQGESSDRYVRKGDEIIRKVKALENELRVTAAVLRLAGIRTYRADMLAKVLAGKRTC